MNRSEYENSEKRKTKIPQLIKLVNVKTRIMIFDIGKMLF